MNSPPPPWRVWILAARPKTLAAAVVPVVVGSAFAARVGAFQAGDALLCLAFAVLVQIGTNYANDYFDFRHGADTRQRIGPVRAVAAGWVTAAAMRRATGLVFAAATLVGFGLIRDGGWAMLLIGCVSIVSGVAYTGGPYPLGYHGLGDVFVFLFFGLVAVGTTFYVQARTLTVDVLLAAAAIGLLTTNILVANNYRDRETDARAGKQTLVVRFGTGAAQWQYTLAVAFSMVLPFILWSRGFGVAVLLPFAGASLGLRCVRGLRPQSTPAELISLLAKTAGYLALYGGLLSAGVVLAR